MVTILLPTAGYIVALFSTREALPVESGNALRIALLALPIVGIEFISSIAFQALGMAWPSVVLTMTQRVLLLLAWVFGLSRAFGPWGVWWSFPATDLSAMLLGLAALILVWKRVGDWGRHTKRRRFDIPG
jgi:Na+-driven multidrug efflux pump